MSYLTPADFPHTRNVDSDLRYIVEMYFKLAPLPEAWEAYQKLMNQQYADFIKQVNDDFIEFTDHVTSEINQLNVEWAAFKTYVENYLKNLDVQDEINNKLDELVADGTIAGLINDDILNAKQTAFLTVADMATSNLVKVDSVCTTAGFHTINDGGGGTYYVTTNTAASPNGANIIQLQDNLSAVLITEPRFVNVLQWGLMRFTPNQDATLAAIFNAAGFAFTLYFPAGDYQFDNAIVLPAKRFNIIGSENNINDVDRNINGTKFVFNTPKANTALLNLANNGKSVVRNIYVISNAIAITVDRTKMSTGTAPVDVFSVTNTVESVTGFRIPSYGCTVENCLCYGCSVGFEFNFFTVATNCFAYTCGTCYTCYNDGTYVGLHGFTCEYGIKVSGSLNQFTSCRFDEIRYNAVEVTTGGANNFVNCNYDYVQYCCYSFRDSDNNFITGDIGRCGTYYAGFVDCDEPEKASYITLWNSNYNKYIINLRRPSVKDGSATPTAPCYGISTQAGCRHNILDSYGLFTTAAIADASKISIVDLARIIKIISSQASFVVNYQGYKYVIPNVTEITAANTLTDTLVAYS